MTPTGPTTAQQVVEAIVENILSGTYPPGSALREDELAAHFGVSRHTVRSALAETGRRRLTVAEPYRGHRVVTFGPEQISGLQQLRCALEGEAVQLIGNRPIPAAVAGLALLDKLAREDPDNWGAIERAHFRLHLGVVDDGGCDRITDAYRDLEDEVLLLVGHLRPHYDAAALVAEHVDYLDAIRQRGPAAVREHLDNSRRLLAQREPS